MLCRDLMTSTPHTCNPSDRVSECARIMLRHDVGFVPVVGDDGRLRGVVTDRDLAVRVLAMARGGDVPVSDVMTLRLVECDPDEDVRVAERRMEDARVSRIVVVTDRRCIGVISWTDIVRVEEPRRAAALVRELAARESQSPAPFG